MRQKFIQIILVSIVFVVPLAGQYWQQWVEYEMDIYLDSEAKTLTATSDLVYVNHSPDTLDQVLMHLYPNAFNEGTIAEQVWAEYGSTFDVEKGWTGIQIQKASQDSSTLQYVIRDDTILDISLNQPLDPGDTLFFQLDWVSIIHPLIDRGGWKAKQFDFTQWYPKFVVYDENGWHDDPFGDWGEFYGEFGKFTLTLDLPLEQIVTATGVVIDGDPGWNAVTVDTSQTWEDWLAGFTEERDTFLADLDSTDRREVTFLADNVHDFAWSCSQDFVYEHGQWNGIDVHVLFNSEVGEEWTRNVVIWGENSLQWLSEKFGMFAWPQITIIKGLLSGGMEYPMLVMDGSDSESLAVHEIGHNWFYGMFGNDELDDAWLDEGFTSFQTLWYLESHYPDNDYSLSRDYITQFEFDNLPLQSYLENDLEKTIRYMRSPSNEPIATHSFDFRGYGSYSYNAYEKGSFILEMLRGYLGEERFLAGMQLYFSRWALKHVNEDRFIQAMEDATGEELDWLFDQWLHTTKYVDYKLVDWSVETHDQDLYITQIHVERKGGMFVPITATIYAENGKSATASLKEFRYRSEGVIEVVSNFIPVSVYLDAENVFLDVDRRNNSSQNEWCLRYDYKGWDEYPDDRNLYLLKPTLGYSDLAGVGLGMNVKRVYRHTESFVKMGLDYNSGSGNPDVSLSFQQPQAGFPFKVTWQGKAQTWRSMAHASLAYEMNWARRSGRNPLHFLTLRVESTDAKYAEVSPSDSIGITRLGLQYEMQDDLLSGDFGFSMSFYTSPGSLGSYGNDFNQLSLMGNWKKNFSFVNLNNRTNFLANSSTTPNLVKSRVASQDLRSVYLDRLASSLHGIANAENIGSHYYLAGGGRLRAYADSMDVPVNYIWSNNLDLEFRTLPLLPKFMKLGMFMDIGQISDDAETWKNVGDAGFALTFKPSWKRIGWISTLIRPFQVKFELSILRYENDSWINTVGSSPWVFTISS